MTVDFQKLQQDVSDIRVMLQLLNTRLDSKPVTITSSEETPLSAQQAADFLGIAPQTLYQNVKKIPHRKRFGKLYFFPSDLREYLKEGSKEGGIA